MTELPRKQEENNAMSSCTQLNTGGIRAHRPPYSVPSQAGGCEDVMITPGFFPVPALLTVFLRLFFVNQSFSASYV